MLCIRAIAAWDEKSARLNSNERLAHARAGVAESGDEVCAGRLYICSKLFYCAIKEIALSRRYFVA